MYEEPFFLYDEFAEERAKLIKELVIELNKKPFKHYKEGKFLLNYIKALTIASKIKNNPNYNPQPLTFPAFNDQQARPLQRPIQRPLQQHIQPQMHRTIIAERQIPQYQQPKQIIPQNIQIPKPRQQSFPKQNVNIAPIIYKPNLSPKLNEEPLQQNPVPKYIPSQSKNFIHSIIQEPNFDLVKSNFILKVEKNSLDEINNKILQIIESSIDSIDKMKNFDSMYQKTIKNYNIKEKQAKKSLIKQELMNSLNGLGKIKPLVDDINVKSIFCQGPNIPVIVSYSDKGFIKTDLAFMESSELNKIVVNIASMASIILTENNPLAEGLLPNGLKFRISLGTHTNNPKFSLVK